jgi:hypothetical protein
MEMDYGEFTLRKINKKCASEIQQINIRNKYLIKYNNRINEINLILAIENSYECRDKLQKK